MQEAWEQAMLRKAAETLGYPQQTLDVSIARKMLAGKTLPNKARRPDPPFVVFSPRVSGPTRDCSELGATLTA
eukprot:9040354-Pyramimonas_sp.AAC.1